MCTSVPYDDSCQSMPPGPANYGYVKSTDAKGVVSCVPVYAILPDNTFKFAVDYTNSDSSIKVNQISLTTVIKSDKTPIPFSTTWTILCPKDGSSTTNPTVTADQNGNITIEFNDPSACGEDLSKFIIFFK